MRFLLTSIDSGRLRNDLEMRYLYSVIADAPIDLDFVKFDRLTTSLEVYEGIMQGYYDLIYFHSDADNILQTKSVAQMIKKASPETGIMLGGMEVSFETHDFMKENPYVDYVVRGEGETVLYNFIKTVIETEFEFDKIAGLAYRTEDGITVNPFDDPIEMNELPFPYERTEPGDDVVLYESMRGTTDRSVHRQYLPDPRIRTLPISRVCAELKYFLVKGVKKVVIDDRWFNFNSERAYRIFEYLISNDNGKTSFEFNIYGDNLDDETIRLLTDARKGLFIFNVDVGSTNAEVLDASGRRCNIYQLMYNVTKLMKNDNVKVVVEIASGLPYETESTFARSFNKSYGLAAGMPIKIEKLHAAKGTRIRKQADRYGYLHSEQPPYEVLSSGHMTARQLITIDKIAAVVDAYLGDGDFKKAFPRILNDTDTRPYELFKSLSLYIDERGYEDKLDKKDELARVLYAFAHELYKELANDDVKLKMLEDVIFNDLESMLSAGQMKKFEKRGWDIEEKEDKN